MKGPNDTRTVLAAMDCRPGPGEVWMMLYARHCPRVELTVDSAAARAFGAKLIAAADRADALKTASAEPKKGGGR